MTRDGKSESTRVKTAAHRENVARDVAYARDGHRTGLHVHGYIICGSAAVRRDWQRRTRGVTKLSAGRVGKAQAVLETLRRSSSAPSCDIPANAPSLRFARSVNAELGHCSSCIAAAIRGTVPTATMLVAMMHPSRSTALMYCCADLG